MPDDIDAYAVRAAVVSLLEEDGYGDRARAVGEEIAAMPDADQVAASLSQSL
jgi:hypothetical protein